MSGKFLVVHMGSFSATRMMQTTSGDGFIFGLEDADGDTMVWSLGGSDSVPYISTDHDAYVIEIDGGYELEETGTFNPATVDHIIWGGTKIVTGATLNNVLTEVHLVERPRLLGGHSGDPGTRQVFSDGLNGNNLALMRVLSAPKMPLAIGDGSTATYWKEDNALIAPYVAASVTDKSIQVSAGFAADLEFYLSANCTLDTTGQIFSGDATTPWLIHASANTGATLTTTAMKVIARDVTTRSGFTISNADFSGCPEINHNDATFSTCSFTSCTEAQVFTFTSSTAGGLQTAIGRLANSSFTSNAVAIRLEYTGTGDIAVVGPVGLTFSSNTTDLHFDSTNSSTLTFTPGSDSDPVTTAISGNAVALNIDSSTAITLSAPNIIDDSRIQIYNVTQANELYNKVVTGGSGVSEATTIGTGLDIVAGDTLRLVATYNVTTTFKRVIVSEISANVTSNVWLDSQEAWTEIEDHATSSAGLDGVVFDDDTVNDTIDVLTNWSFAQFAAWWGYIITTELGIREWYNAITFIDNSTARINNATVDLYLDNNLSTTRWQTTTGRIYRADGARPVLDPPTDAGLDPQWILPVLAFPTGSALTAAENTQLMSLPSASQTVNEWETQSQADPTGFHVNVKEINGATVQGDGTDGDDWRGAGVDPQ